MAAKASLLVAGVLIGLLLVEAILRLLGNPYELATLHPDPDLGYTLRPGLRATVGGVRHEYNTRGLRDRDYPDAPSAGTTRILAVGDSVTFAETLPLELSYVKVLERSLNSSGPHAFEVIDGGVAGYNACQEEAFLRDIGLQYHPQIVIWQYCLNDLDDAWRPYAASNRGFIPIPLFLKQGLREHSYTWNFLRTRVFVLMHGIGLMGDAQDDQDYARRILEHYTEAGPGRMQAGWNCIERAAGMVQAQGGRMLVVIVPFSMQVESSAGMPDTPQREITRRCEASGIACLDLLPIFRNEIDPHKLFLLPDFVHLSVEGHRVMARTLEQAISPGLKGSSRQRRMEPTAGAAPASPRGSSS